MVNAEFSRIYRFVKLLVNEGFLAVPAFKIYFLYITSEVNSTMRSKFTFVPTYITFIL